MDKIKTNFEQFPIGTVGTDTYIAVLRRSYHCSDCDLFDICNKLDKIPCVDLGKDVIFKVLDRGMTLGAYQRGALSTAISPKDSEVAYLALAMCGEAGELADKVKKVIRDHNNEYTADLRKAMAEELGDVLWYAANLANAIGYSLEDVCRMNLRKIESRRQRGKIHGEGDNR